MGIAYREASPAIYKAIKVAHRHGLIMVASVGNRSNWDDSVILSADGGASDDFSDALDEFSVMYPARYPEVISVGAVNQYGNFAYYSNYGKEIDILAPGSNILSSDVTNGDIYNGYGFCSGTSQATAHVTAAVALMLSSDPSLSPEEIEDIIVSTATNVRGTGFAGKINLIDALERLSRNGNTHFSAYNNWSWSWNPWVAHSWNWSYMTP